MRYYPAGKKCKLDYLDWPLSHSGYPWLNGGHSETPRRAGDFHPLSGHKEDPPTQWGTVVDCNSPAGGRPGGSDAETSDAGRLAGRLSGPRARLG